MSWYLPVWCNVEHRTLLGKAGKTKVLRLSVQLQRRKRKVVPGTATSCSTRKEAICFILLRRIIRLKIVSSESDRGSHFLPRKAFPEGLMSSCRIRHESHTYFGLSYRIVMWNATVVQKHQQTKITRRDEPVYIYIYIRKHRRQWQYKATAINYVSPQLRLKCAQGRKKVRFHRYPGVSSLATDPLGPRWPPAVKRSFTSGHTNNATV